jgi:ATP-binding cassette subfamily B protein
MQLISSQLGIAPAEPVIANLGKEFEILDFQLGDSLTGTSSCPESSLPTEQDSPYFYVICQGRVRLLSANAEKQPQVSVQLLSEGDTFGGESFLVGTSLPYEAIAAEQVVQVARITLERLRIGVSMERSGPTAKVLALFQDPN